MVFFDAALSRCDISTLHLTTDRATVMVVQWTLLQRWQRFVSRAGRPATGLEHAQCMHLLLIT